MVGDEVHIPYCVFLQKVFKMSFPSVQKEDISTMPPTDYPAKPTYKSYRKKYLKMRHGFKAKMRESNTLFDDEQATIRIAHRLQEQNESV